LGGWEDVEDVRIYMNLKSRSGEAEYGRKAQGPFKSPVITSCADGGGGKAAMEEKGFIEAKKSTGTVRQRAAGGLIALARVLATALGISKASKLYLVSNTWLSLSRLIAQICRSLFFAYCIGASISQAFEPFV